MEILINTLLTALVSGSVVGAVLYFLNGKKSGETSSKENLNLDSTEVVVEAKARAKELVLEAKNEVLKIKEDAEQKLNKMRKEYVDMERDLAVKKAEVETKDKELQSREADLEKEKQKLEQRRDSVAGLEKKRHEELQRIAGMSREEAREKVLSSFGKELAEDKVKMLRQMEEDIKKNADEKAKEILMDAMRYGATDYVVEYTISKVLLPDEDMKGRIIGKEGRNIKLFEELTGTQLDLDGSPGEVLISCFDPTRREIARVALEKLLKDGRIQPAKIEEIVEQTEKEIEKIMYKEGENLCHRVGAYNVPKELIQMLGKFKYRFSYGQNMIEHTLEETRIGIALAHSLKADVDIVRLGCLFHDIGKIVTDSEGTHVQLGVELLQKYKIDSKVVDCVAEHHEDRPFSHIESAIVHLADHISGARPGSRSEDYDEYIKRLKALEDAAVEFDGVSKAYAISAGREVRVFVDPEKVNDDTSALLAREIAKKIELEQTYPGVVKVHVIRQTRYTETAK